MPEYLYVATNPAMPGLLKIGHTTREPDARMRELQTTGVPRPFELELVLIVEDGMKAERTAHRLFDNRRESSSREFFRLSLEKAVASILSNVVHQSVDWNFTPSDSKSRTIINSHLSAKLSTLDSEIDETTKKISRIETARPTADLRKTRADLQDKISVLGRKPASPDIGGVSLFAFAYYPVPVGWVFWLGSFAQFSMGNIDVAIALASCIGVGFFTHRAQERREETHQKSLLPWSEIEEELAKVQRELDSRDSLAQSLRSLQAKKVAIADSLRSNSNQPVPSGDLLRSRDTTASRALEATNPLATSAKLPANSSNTSSSANRSSGRGPDSPMPVARLTPTINAPPVAVNKTGVVIYSTSNCQSYQIFEVENGYAVVIDEDLYIYETKSFVQSAVHSRLMSASDMSKEGLLKILKKGTFFPKYP